MCCYGNCNPKTLAIPFKSVDIILLYYALCVVIHIKVEGVTIKKSNQATLSSCELN